MIYLEIPPASLPPFEKRGKYKSGYYKIDFSLLIKL